MIISVNAPPAPFVPEQFNFMPGYIVVVVGFGSAQDHAGVLAPIRAALPPLFEFVTSLPYTQLQQMFDEGAQWGVNCYEKALYLDELTDEAIAVITEQQARKTSPMSLLEFYRLGGAYAEVDEDETAFGGRRKSRFGVIMVGLAGNPELLVAERAWVQSFLGGAAAARDRCRRLRQCHDRVRGGSGACLLPAGQVRATGPGQGSVRPRQRLPPQRQHQTRVTADLTDVACEAPQRRVVAWYLVVVV